jgi:hypothetical protein
MDVPPERFVRHRVKLFQLADAQRPLAHAALGRRQDIQRFGADHGFTSCSGNESGAQARKKDTTFLSCCQ